jgi:hypothetical protein
MRKQYSPQLFAVEEEPSPNKEDTPPIVQMLRAGALKRESSLEELSSPMTLAETPQEIASTKAASAAQDISKDIPSQIIEFHVDRN